MTQGIHLPSNIYTYMEDNFFVWICNIVSNFNATESKYLDVSQSYLALQECQCKGQDYFGMPAIQLYFNPDESSDEKAVFYFMPPNQFELFPKVNKLLRTTFCNLALWNLEGQYPNVTQYGDVANNWAVGQVFIR